MASDTKPTRRGLREYLSDPAVVVIALAFCLFAIWQFVNHYLLMTRLRLTMLEYHSVSWAVETTFAAIMVVYVVREFAKKNRQLRELDYQKEMLTHALVHDLRQPLTAVLGGLDTAALDEQMPDSTRELLEIAQQGGRELLAMINDLLDISKMEAGQPLLHVASAAASEFIPAGVNDVVALAREKAIEVSVNVPEDLPRVQGDAARLRRAVMNLVGNAVKFTPSGGTIAVGARIAPEGGKMLVSVADSGEGIPKEFQERVFDKFFVLDGRSQGARTSTGLGLTFCKMIVEAHRGEIGVESEPGKGSTFTFSLPLAGASKPLPK